MKQPYRQSLNTLSWKNWIEDEGLFIGEDDDGLIKYEEIKANSEGDITVCFEGEYLGGNVNKNLSFPEEITIVLKQCKG